MPQFVNQHNLDIYTTKNEFNINAGPWITFILATDEYRILSSGSTKTCHNMISKVLTNGENIN